MMLIFYGLLQLYILLINVFNINDVLQNGVKNVII